MEHQNKLSSLLHALIKALGTEPYYCSTTNSVASFSVELTSQLGSLQGEASAEGISIKATWQGVEYTDAEVLLNALTPEKEQVEDKEATKEEKSKKKKAGE